MRVIQEFSELFDISGQVFKITNEMAFVVAGASSLPYTHTQASASSTWTVNHNFGYRPLVEVFSVGWVEIEASITHINENQVSIQFNSPQSGFAICE